MATTEKKKSGGGKLSRSETVTVRLDPQLRYLVELAARKQRRTVSSFIEWALEEGLGRIWLKEASQYNEPISIADEKQNLWDVDEADRFAKLALRYPDMLNHHEQVLWKIIRENSWVWRGRYNNNGKWTWDVDIAKLNFHRLREHWDNFNRVAKGEADKSILPTVVDQSSSASKTLSDDEIPF